MRDSVGTYKKNIIYIDVSPHFAVKQFEQFFVFYQHFHIKNKENIPVLIDTVYRMLSLYALCSNIQKHLLCNIVT